jgi:hypothetical protein
MPVRKFGEKVARFRASQEEAAARASRRTRVPRCLIEFGEVAWSEKSKWFRR